MTRFAPMRSVAVAGLLCLVAVPRAAQAVVVSFHDVDFGVDATDTVAVIAGPEIAEGDGSDIGTNVFLGGEFIDLGASSIQYRVRGDGPIEVAPGFFNTGWSDGAYFVFSDLVGPAFRITAVGITLDNVVGVAPGTEVTFTDSSVSLVIGTLGVGETPLDFDLGTITLDLRIEPVGPAPVPEPGTLALLGLGLSALGWHGRRRG